MISQDKPRIVSLLFDENEVRVLRWLFDDGLQAAGRSGDKALARQIADLAPRIWNIRPDIGIVFDAAEIALLARTMSLGQRSNRDLLKRIPVRSADLLALELLQKKALVGPGRSFLN